MSTENIGFILDQFVDINDYVWIKLKKDKKLLSNRNGEITYCENIYDTAYKIDRKFHHLLEVILNYPNLNIKRIEEIYSNYRSIGKRKSGSTEKHNRYRKIERMIKDLENIHLIEKVESKRIPIGNFKNKSDAPYRLTIHGIFFVLLNNEFIGLFQVVGSLLKNYPNNKIYQIFLYPYFEKESLEELGIYLFPLIIWYLKDILKMIIANIQLWLIPEENMIDGYILRPIFSWPKYENTAIDFIEKIEGSSELRHYLYQEFGWDWIYAAKINAKPVLNLISITSDQTNQNIVIRINRQDKKANLVIDGKIFNIFKVDDGDDSNHLSINGKFKNVKKMINADLEYGTKMHLLELIFGIRNYDLQIFPELKNTLFKDIKFKKITEEMINVLKIPS